VNCIEAQVLLAAHRELKQVDEDNWALADHLELCSQCRQVLANDSLIGEQVRALPVIQPPAEMHGSLMRALAAEHFQFMQRSPASAPPTPDFLKPYMREHAHSSHTTDPLAAFSSASTGPLPVLKTPYAKRSRRRISGQFAVIGLAAVFFMTLMMGGITSLLLLANGRENPASPSAINQPTEVQQEAYTTATPYQHVVSAVGDATSIYYSGYGSDTNSGWMLERLDRDTKISTPLFAAPSTTPLVILGSANGWLVWLQFDTTNSQQGRVLHGPTHTLMRGWSLNYLSLVAPLHAHATTPVPATRTLLSGTFDQATAPSWVHTPVQGIWFMHDSLLVASTGADGVSRLESYPLSATGSAGASTIAQADPGHIFASPTATGDGSQIFWADEWVSADNAVHSNIWTRQELSNSVSRPGSAVQRPIEITRPYLQNGASFRPAVVDDELFLLDSSGQLGTAASTGGTPTTTQAATPSPSVSPNTNTTALTSWADSSIYTPALDMGVRGNAVVLPLENDPFFVTPLPLINGTAASGLQAGTGFVFWQTPDGTFNMFDAATKLQVNLNNDQMNGAQFMAVNGTTAVWTTDTGATNASGNGSPSPLTLQAFNWPRR
jgi:hypothetical protein